MEASSAIRFTFKHVSFFPSLCPVRSILTLVLMEAEGLNLSTYLGIIFTAKTFSGLSKGMVLGTPL